MPKVGPFKAMAFNNPTAQTEDLYFKSINATVDAYRVFLNEVGSNTLVLSNLDLDSGKPIIAAEYSLADQTYATLMKRLSDSKFALTSAALRDDVIGFYSDEAEAAKAKNEAAPWQNIQATLAQMRLSPAVVFVDGSKMSSPVPTRLQTTHYVHY
jgi:hypothetical protein